MKKLVLRKKDNHPDNHPDIPEGMDPQLLKMKIRIVGEGEATEKKVYFEGSVKTFLIERLPQQQLINLIGELLEKESVDYCLSRETLRIERIE